MKSKYQRTILAINCAASYFNMFSKQENRGPNWNKDLMRKFIADFIKTQAFLYNIPEHHVEQMVLDGLEFYARHLEDVLPQ